MRKAGIIIIYFLLFWIFLPLALLILAILFDKHIFMGMILPGCCIITGLIILLPALFLLLLSVYQFRKFSGEFPVSATPPDNIIQKGVFSIWRHPIYLFTVITFIGLALFLQSFGFLFIVIPFFILCVAFYIKFEEKALSLRFGALYTNYRLRTRLIIPGLHCWLKALILPFFKLYLGIKIYNKHNIPASPPFFIVASHRNYLDPFFISSSLPWPVRHISTFEMFRTKIKRKIFSLLGAIPKKRYTPDTRSVMLLKRALERRYPVGIFPSGERSWTGKTQSFKPGTVQMLRKFKHIPILPVRIEGNYFLWPRWSPKMLRAKVRISFEEMITVTDDMNNEKLQELLIQKITPSSDAERLLYCRSKNRIGELSRLLYRCPGCREKEALFEIPPDKLICSNCKLIIEIDRQFNVHFDLYGENQCQSIDQVYNTIKITTDDLIKPEIVIQKSVGISGDDSDNAFFCASCLLYIEQYDEFVLLGKGIIYLTEKALMIVLSDNIVHITLNRIGGATIESYYRLQIYIPSEKKLFQVVLESDSVVKWQDALVLLMKRAGLSNPATR